VIFVDDVGVHASPEGDCNVESVVGNVVHLMYTPICGRQVHSRALAVKC